MANVSKTTKKCTKCFVAKLHSEFSIVEGGRMSNWCSSCLESFEVTRKKSTTSSHYSEIKSLKYDKSASVTRSFFESRINELKDKIDNGACSLTKDTLKLNELMFSYLF